MASRASGQNKPRVTPATLARHLGTLRMFFVRIQEWGWDEAPVRVPMFPGDLPRLDRPLPKALDDPAAAGLLRAARAERKPLVGLTVELLLRTTSWCSRAVHRHRRYPRRPPRAGRSTR